MLLTGEYLVLKGAEALAIPLRFGQKLEVKYPQNRKKGILDWKSKENSCIWFEASFDLHYFSVLTSNDETVAFRLSKLLSSAKLLNPLFLSQPISVNAESLLNFNRNWGLGSSSTLVSNVAYWSDTDPYKLLELAFGGSGYDIACARTNSPLLYKLDNGPILKEVDINLPFKDNLWFVYLGKKQNSSDEIKSFLKGNNISDGILDQVSKISNSIVSVNLLEEFNELIREHERLLASILKRRRVKEELFPDFHGEIKSLGAWGGDFIMASSDMDPLQIKNYFMTKGLDTIFVYSDIVL